MKPPITAFCLLFMCLLVTTASSADFAAGKKAFDQGDYGTAAREWDTAANKGDAAAQYWLGLLYESGRGVDKDEVAGRRWQLLAAERGYEYAQNALAWPIKTEDRPSLTCSSSRPDETQTTERQQPIQADSIKGFEFWVTLHNARPPVERPIMSADNMSQKPEFPNIQINVFRIESGRRIAIPYSINSSGGGAANPRGAISD